jgi:amino acid transporter
VVRRGLRLFASTATPRQRRRRLIFVAVMLAATAAVVWPGPAWFAAPRPFVLGLPAPFAWVVAWLLIVFGALVWLYRGDYAGGDGEGEGGNP